jgi:hypothetical protein
LHRRLHTTYSSNDICHLQHTSEGYLKQVMQAPFRAFGAREVFTDDSMILLDVSGSMDFEPLRSDYNEYLIAGYARSNQPKNNGEPSLPSVPYDVRTISYNRYCQGYHPSLYQCNDRPRPQFSELPAHHFLRPRQQHWLRQSSELRRNVEKH